MAERPILFSAPMVRAILAGTKTQTRRVVKWRGLQPGLNLGFSGLSVERSGSNFVLSSPTRTSHEYRSVPQPCPYGQPGDQLWVRETWHTVDGAHAFYRADYQHDPKGDREHGITWRPSIHMPRWASRITLVITGVCVERLQAISEDDARAEGCAPAWLDADDNETVHVHAQPTYRQGFARLWRDINGAESWSADPFCWVVEFKRVTP
jgi:hypothetical protein